MSQIEVPASVPAATNGSRSRRDGAPRAASTRSRRTRSPHPGVVLLRPDPAGRHPSWRARFEDPDTGRTTKITLDPMALSTAEARRDWAIRKSKALARRRMELETGAPRTTGTAFSEAI